MKRKSSFLVTASSMTQTDFQLAHPLVRVRSGKIVKFDFEAEEGEGGKVLRINKVDKEMLDYFMQHHLYPVMQKAAYCYQRRKFGALASCFFPVFTYLAPRASDADLLRRHEQGAAVTDGVTGVTVSSSTSREQEAAWSSTSGEHDGQSRETLELVGTDSGHRQPMDFRGYGTLGNEEPFLNQSISLLLCDAKPKSLVWEPDTNEDSDLFQVAGYTCCAAVANVDKGRFKPIHMLVLADGEYGLAVLHVQGYLQVDKGEKITGNACKGNKITDDSFNVFLHQQESKWRQENPGGKWKKLSLEEQQKLRKQYQDRVDATRLRMEFLHMDSVVPMDKKLVVGEVNFYPLTRRWTRFPIAYAFQRWTTDDYIFVAGMLRVLYGDRVLLWKKATLEALAAAHDAELIELGGNLPHFLTAS